MKRINLFTAIAVLWCSYAIYAQESNTQPGKTSHNSSQQAIKYCVS